MVMYIYRQDHLFLMEYLIKFYIIKAENINFYYEMRVLLFFFNGIHLKLSSLICFKQRARKKKRRLTQNSESKDSDGANKSESKSSVSETVGISLWAFFNS